MLLETIKEETFHTRISKLGKPHKVKRTRTVYRIKCNVCGRILHRSKAETANIAMEKDVHCCSFECVGKISSGSRWKGHKPKPKRRKSGYIYIGKRRQHRVFAEEMLGRPLQKDEVVHHINGDKGDNTFDNLLVCSKKEHNRIHGQLEALAFLLYQKRKIWFCKSCRLYILREEKCGCGSSFSV